MDTILEDDFSIELTKDEVYTLLGHFGPAAILGMTHPYRGLLSEEIALATGKALQSLLRRNLITIGEGEVHVDPDLETAVQICAHPQHSLIIQAQRINELEQRIIIHFHDCAILEQLEYKPGFFRLTKIQDREGLLSQLGALFQLDSEGIVEADPLYLDELLLFEVRALCAEGRKEEAVEALLGTGLSEEQFLPLLRTLSAPVFNASLALVANRDHQDTQYVRGFTILGSEEHLWILHPLDNQDKNRLQIIPATSEMVQEHFKSILP